MATTAGTAGISVRGARVLGEELARLRDELGEQAFRASRFREAGEVFEQVALADAFVEFLTVPAYERLDRGR